MPWGNGIASTIKTCTCQRPHREQRNVMPAVIHRMRMHLYSPAGIVFMQVMDGAMEPVQWPRDSLVSVEEHEHKCTQWC